MHQFSEHIVYVDESGDHGLTTINKEFPLFVLTFCIFKKSDYIERVVPAFQQRKFKHFGHDMVVMHEREIRKAEGAFACLTDSMRRATFMNDINALVLEAPFHIVAVLIRKAELVKKTHAPENHYHLALQLGLEGVDGFLQAQDQRGLPTHIVFEARGKKGDNELELAFRRICGGANRRDECLPFRLILADK
jgi:hypothetical protein